MNRLFPILANEWYHVYNRGNDHQTLFHEPADYRAFMTKMDQTCERYRVKRIACVLMPNHFHTILMQLERGNLPRMMNALGTSYARRYNLKHSHEGHVFQGRYRYTLIPTEDLLHVVARYIRMNPVCAGLVRNAEDWQFSDFAPSVQGVLHQG